MILDVKYKTGVVWQDFQHKQLIDLFEKIEEARSKKTDQNLYRYTLAFLAMYVNHHFKLEEAYMKKFDYPDQARHQKEHRDFIKDLKAFKAKNEVYSSEGSDELLNRMKEWILNHILADDQTLGAFILKKEVPVET